MVYRRANGRPPAEEWEIVTMLSPFMSCERGFIFPPCFLTAIIEKEEKHLMASEKIIAQKQQYVDELTKKLENAAGGVIVDYKGITVAEDTALRKALREAGVDYFVVKNTLLRRAAEKAGITGIEEHLEGTTALALHESDIISAPKILYKQAQDCGDARFNIKIGFIGKEAISVQEVEEYAKLPSKEVLISKLLFMLQSPMQRLAIAASEIAKKKDEEGAA